MLCFWWHWHCYWVINNIATSGNNSSFHLRSSGYFREILTCVHSYALDSSEDGGRQVLAVCHPEETASEQQKHREWWIVTIGTIRGRSKRSWPGVLQVRRLKLKHWVCLTGFFVLPFGIQTHFWPTSHARQEDERHEKRNRGRKGKKDEWKKWLIAEENCKTKTKVIQSNALDRQDLANIPDRLLN